MAKSPLEVTARNRTGLAVAEDRDLMLHGVDGFTPVGSRRELEQQRVVARSGQSPIGSMVPPATIGGRFKQVLRALRGETIDVFLDQIGERLAFERTGTRLYDAVLEKLAQFGGFSGGPDELELRRIRDDEAAHFGMLTDVLADLGGDPTAITPSANLAAVASSGVLKVVTDPRTTVGECLDAMLIAELVDDDAWKRLILLARDLGQDELAVLWQSAAQDEERHLSQLRTWVQAHCRLESGVATN